MAPAIMETLDIATMDSVQKYIRNNIERKHHFKKMGFQIIEEEIQG